ncbi:MAG: prepilin-type N-terminal cleavage/methylation domain-containing protein [Planctomycetota bacterium]
MASTRVRMAWRLAAALAGAIAMTVALWVLLKQAQVPARWPSPMVVLACLALGVMFINLKSLALRCSARHAGVPLRFRTGARLLCEGVAIECLSWPGKLWADGYRVKMLGAGPVRTRVLALAIFRIASIVGVMVALALAAAAIDGFSSMDGMALLGVVLMGLVFVRIRTQQAGAATARHLRGLIMPVVLSLFAVIVDAAAASLIAWSLAGVDPLVFAACFMVCSVLASASGMPLGLGVLDAAGWIVLTGFFGVDAGTAAAVVLLHRLCGPVLTLLIGSLLLLQRGLPDLVEQLQRLPTLEPHTARARNASAFSLIELVLVVVIIGIISAIAVPRLSSGTDNAYKAKALQLDKSLENGIVLYLREYGELPKSFKSWVGATKDASADNYLNLEPIRPLMKDPSAAFSLNDQTIRIEFKSGLIVQYNIDNAGNLTSTYTDPS